MRKTIVWETLIGLSCFLVASSGAIAAQPPANSPTPSMHSMPHSSAHPSQFQQIDQPLTNKILVTLIGLGLMGLELWWFLLSKPKPRS
jgi:plastocyanin domain-containing protein